jgi:hypothetical protein
MREAQGVTVATTWVTSGECHDLIVTKEFSSLETLIHIFLYAHNSSCLFFILSDDEL